MTIYQILGDLLHVISILLLMYRLMKFRSAVGISCRMQEIYFIVFVTRYLDVLYNFVTLYLTFMKIIYIASTGYLIYIIRYKESPIKNSYDRSLDAFPYEKYLIGPAFALALITTSEYSISEILWTFSVWLESVAILPQLVMLQQQKEIENLTSNFVAAMGAYRAMYILNWISKYSQGKAVAWQSVITGLIQTALYVDFFYFYTKAKWYGQTLILPE
jgi:ER lumen protein retaining receptor